MVNKCIFIGNLTRDGELAYTPSGMAIAKFSMAINETWTDKQGQKNEKTEFVNCAMFGKRAESLNQYLQKGKKIFVCGRLQTSTTEKDGEKRYYTSVNVDELQFLSSGNSAPKNEPKSESASVPGYSATDLPF
jgi:single-strand DNA-binding protein